MQSHPIDGKSASRQPAAPGSRGAKGSKPVTVRIPATLLERLMRARGAKTRSSLINALLREEDERLRSWRVLRQTEGAGTRSEAGTRGLAIAMAVMSFSASSRS